MNQDIVLLLNGVVSSLRPMAKDQEVGLSFQSEVGRLRATYDPEEITAGLTKMLSLIISFTPQSNIVKVNFKKCRHNNKSGFLTIENTGINLERINEISNATSYNTTVQNIDNRGTKFSLELPLTVLESVVNNGQVEKRGKLNFSPYYSEIRKRLTSHFANIENMEKVALQQGRKEGTFLKRVNAHISSRMHDNNFKVDDLATALALSRTQLFRKIKTLTLMPPGQYLLFYRLHAAKKLLLSEDENLNVSDVCYRVGFMSQSHFTRSFQKQFGFNPSDCK